jgi:hypothetical protein
MNNLLSYCGLTDARMRASEKDLHVQTTQTISCHFLAQFTRIKIFLKFNHLWLDFYIQIGNEIYNGHCEKRKACDFNCSAYGLA